MSCVMFQVACFVAKACCRYHQPLLPSHSMQWDKLVDFEVSFRLIWGIRMTPKDVYKV